MRFVNPRSPVGRLRRSDWLVISALVAVQIMVSIVSTLENGLAVTVSLGVLAAIVQSKWDLRRDPRMWALIGLVASVQLPAIFLVRIPRMSTGLVFAPFAVIEGLALLGMLNWIDRRFPRHGNGARSPGSVPHAASANILRGIARGEQAIEGGRGVSHVEARSRMARWLS